MSKPLGALFPHHPAPRAQGSLIPANQTKLAGGGAESPECVAEVFFSLVLEVTQGVMVPTVFPASTKINIDIQAAACEECCSLSLTTGGNADYDCVQCADADDLHSQMAQLQDEVLKLRE